MKYIPRRTKSKKKCERDHTKRRMFERYGIKLTDIELDQMAAIYRKGKDSEIFWVQSNRVVKAFINFKGKGYPIVYDRQRHQIVTVLPPEYLSDIQKKYFTEFCEKIKSQTTKPKEVKNGK